MVPFTRYRPATIIKSDWRGLARMSSMPNRSYQTTVPVHHHSIAQQASPKSIGTWNSFETIDNFFQRGRDHTPIASFLFYSHSRPFFSRHRYIPPQYTYDDKHADHTTRSKFPEIPLPRVKKRQAQCQINEQPATST